MREHFWQSTCLGDAYYSYSSNGVSGGFLASPGSGEAARQLVPGAAALLVRGLTGRGESPAQHSSHAGEGELGKPEHQGLCSIKRRANITCPLSTTNPGHQWFCISFVGKTAGEEDQGH